MNFRTFIIESEVNSFYSKENFKYKCIFDCFSVKGYDFLYNYIKYIDFNIIFDSVDPINNLLSVIDMLIPYHIQLNCGSSFLLVKIYKNKIETFSIGNCRALILINDEIKYFNNIHDATNINEVKRLKNNFKISYKKKISIINDEEVIISNYSIFVFKNRCLNISQFLGYNSLTGYNPEINTINYNNDDKIKVILGTQQFWDMILIEFDLPYLKFLEETRLYYYIAHKIQKEWYIKNKINNINQLNKIKLDIKKDYALSILSNY